MRIRINQAPTDESSAQADSASTQQTADEVPGSRRGLHGGSYLYLVFDCERPWAGGSRFDLSTTDEVVIGRGNQHEAFRQHAESTRRLSLTLPTATLSSKHARLLRVGSDWAIQDRGSRNGTWLNTRRIDYAELSDGDVFQVGRAFFRYRRHEALPPNTIWPDVTEESTGSSLPCFASLNPELVAANQALRAIAKSSISVLILGCTGVGKELCARAVHEISARSGEFFAVNCGAIPTGLVESTLFGHVKGAFSGAVSNHVGAVRAAEGGTLFLDEVGDLPLVAQATLLRVLQEGEVTPIGATKPIPVDVRIAAATHQPLQQLVEQKRFRADLYARLAGYVHRLPPLEDRLEDFGVLFAQLLRRIAGNGAVDVSITTEAGWALLRHPWPLNIRELEQAIERAVVLGGTGPLGVAHFPFVLEQRPRPMSGIRERTESADVALRKQLDELMREHHGNVAAVARVLGKGPTQIQRWLKRLGMMADGYRG